MCCTDDHIHFEALEAEPSSNSACISLGCLVLMTSMFTVQSSSPDSLAKLSRFLGPTRLFIKT